MYTFFIKFLLHIFGRFGIIIKVLFIKNLKKRRCRKSILFLQKLKIFHKGLRNGIPVPLFYLLNKKFDRRLSVC